MAQFDPARLVRALPQYSAQQEQGLSAEITAYLEHYQLSLLAAESDYCVGRMTLDDVETVVQSFKPKAEQGCHGTVIVVHGYMDHFALYRHLSAELLAEGYQVIGYDLSGHGLAAGDPLHVDDFQHYATQLAQLIQTIGADSKTDGPLHLIGQSTGAAVIMAYQLLFGGEMAAEPGARILLAPLVRPSLWRSIQRKFRWFKYVLKRVPRRYSQNSHDALFLDFVAHEDSLQYREIPVSWIGAMLAWGDWVEAHQSVTGPVHMIQGTDDGTVDWRHNMAVLGRLFPELELTLIKDAKHHLVNESPVYRQQAFNQITRILNSHKKGQP